MAIIRWTGRGSLDHLSSTIRDVIDLGGESKVAIKQSESSIFVSGSSAVGTALQLRYLPGIDWIAVGRTFQGQRQLMKVVRALAQRYLTKEKTFIVTVEGSRAPKAADVQLSVITEVLSTVKRARTNETNPKINFMCELENNGGAFGVKLADGEAGVPTSRDRKAFCLVSGGRHSSVMTWLAALSGFSLNMVHFMVGDDALRHVSLLYSELSHRMNPKHLRLVVVVGTGDSGQRKLLNQWLRDRNPSPVFAGIHLECKERKPDTILGRVPEGVEFPVLLIPERTILEVQRKLSLKGLPSESDFLVRSRSSLKTGFRVLSFGGVKADINQVLDGLSSH